MDTQQTEAPTETDLDLEFAWTRWEGSCRDPLVAEDGDLRECRRPRGHQPGHASGFGDRRIRWT